jgi:RNA polymerase sigma-70 factor, ECF subfamily
MVRVESTWMSVPMRSPKFERTLDLSLPSKVSTDAPAGAREAEDTVLRLFDESGPAILRYLKAFGLAPEAAEDIRQEVFLALFRHLRLGRPRGNLKGWVFHVAHNLALRLRRQQLTRQRTEREWESALPAADPTSTPEDRLLDDQYQQRLRSVLAAMPERDQRCVSLRAEGLCYRDIAQTLDISLGSVAKSLARAITRLTMTDRG